LASLYTFGDIEYHSFRWNNRQILESARISIADLSGQVELAADGVWHACRNAAISYPAESNQLLYEVEDKSFWFSHRNCCIVEALRRYSPSGAFFDIGGGNGCVSAAIQKAGWPVVLLEPGAAGARNARCRGIEHVICSTLDEAGLKLASLDAAGAFDVIEHIEDDLAFLREVGGILRPGGRLYVTVPAFPFLWSQEDTDTGHYRRYTLRTIEAVLQKAGFAVEYSTYFFGCLPPAILLQRSLPYRLGIRFGRQSVEQQARAQHEAGGGIAGRILAPLFDREVLQIRKGERLSFGSSCLAVARVKPSA
jgi:SAM-dependent methyltransferase